MNSAIAEATTTTNRSVVSADRWVAEGRRSLAEPFEGRRQLRSCRGTAGRDGPRRNQRLASAALHCGHHGVPDGTRSTLAA